jgi:hypothetical protein
MKAMWVTWDGSLEMMNKRRATLGHPSVALLCMVFLFLGKVGAWVNDEWVL